LQLLLVNSCHTTSSDKNSKPDLRNFYATLPFQQTGLGPEKLTETRYCLKHKLMLPELIES